MCSLAISSTRIIYFNLTQIQFPSYPPLTPSEPPPLLLDTPLAFVSFCFDGPLGSLHEHGCGVQLFVGARAMQKLDSAAGGHGWPPKHHPVYERRSSPPSPFNVPVKGK